MSELIYYDLKRSVGMAPSLSTQVARELGRRIVSGSYEAGSLIDDENALTRRYQVSKVVVRDAVKILVGKGMLDVRRGIGTRVRPRSEWVLLDDDVLAWHLSAPVNEDFLKQLIDIRLTFEPKAARWAAERATEEDMVKIHSAYEKMEGENGTVENFVIADALFHQTILRAAHNEFLSAMEGVVYSALLVSIRVTNMDPRDNSETIDFHRAVYEAIVARDGDQAENLTHRLLADANQRLQKHFS
ncbi:FadR family transcriptional regulator [Marinomonas agarivorans]|nr:FadR family transcriptional regulator [Marinomonas agarivorans]